MSKTNHYGDCQECHYCTDDCTCDAPKSYREDEITCPYCGEQESDSWERIDSDPDEVDCESCGKTFSLEIEMTASYNTSPIDDPEGGEE